MDKPKSIHLQLPSDAMANVSADATPETLHALDAMVRHVTTGLRPVRSTAGLDELEAARRHLEKLAGDALRAGDMELATRRDKWALEIRDAIVKLRRSSSNEKIRHDAGSAAPQTQKGNKRHGI